MLPQHINDTSPPLLSSSPPPPSLLPFSPLLSPSPPSPPPLPFFLPFLSPSSPPPPPPLQRHLAKSPELEDRDPDSAWQPDRRSGANVNPTRDPNPITQNSTLLLTYSTDPRGPRPEQLFSSRTQRPQRPSSIRKSRQRSPIRRCRFVSTRSTMTRTAMFSWPMWSKPILRRRRPCPCRWSSTR